ncbi:AAA family ATPase [Sulfuricurvum sp.]|uniref:AAA family ATPase n=1 Tax=Sulfuricurvum sp. TaxID=2025608 RepID=UPI003562F32D
MIESKFKMTRPVYSFPKEKILLYGTQKIGKTQITQFLSPKMGFIAAERGDGKISALSNRISGWDDFTSCMSTIKNEPIDMIAIDTITALWYMFVDWFLKANGIQHEQDIAWGVGRDRLIREFVLPINELQRCGKGVILIAHEKQCEENGKIIIRPSLPTDKNNQIRDAILAMVDSVWYLRYRAKIEKGETTKVRELRTKGDPQYVAGGRYNMDDPIELVTDDPRASAELILAAYKRVADAATGAEKPIQKELMK